MSSSVKALKKGTSTLGLWCFWAHMIIAAILGSILVAIGAYSETPRQSAMATVVGIISQPGMNHYQVTVQFVDTTGKTVTTTFLSSKYYPVNSNVRVYYSDSNDVSDVSIGGRIFLWIGVAIIVVYIIIGVLVYYSEWFRMFYGAMCGFRIMNAIV